MTEQKIVHKTKEEIEAEVEVDYEQFFLDKKFNEDSPLQYTNKVIIEQIAKEADAKGKAKHDPRSFLGKAVVMFQTDYPAYRELMEKAGWEYSK